MLKAIEAAREDGLEISVTGMDEFDIADFSTEIGGRAAVADFGDGVADAQEGDFQEAGAEVFERHAAGREGPDRSGDRRRHD